MNPILSQGPRKEEDKFEFNKDEGLYVKQVTSLTEKHALVKKERTKIKARLIILISKSARSARCERDVIKKAQKVKPTLCRLSLLNTTIKRHFNRQLNFKEIAKSLYNIEAKISELKNGYGYDIASSAGLFGMEIQGATAMFTVNLKRILTMLKEKEKRRSKK